MRVSLVIPTLNEEKCIGRTLKEIPKGIIDEIIVVDKSNDRTAEIAKEFGCKVFRQERFGFGDAFRQGIKQSSGDVLVLMDSDGSHNPKDIPKLLKKIKEGYDCVLASRYTIESHSEDDTLVRSFGNWLITTFLNLLFHINTTDSLFLFTAIRKKAYDKLKMETDSFDYCIEYLVKAYINGLKLAEIPSIERKRYAGKSKLGDVRHGYLLIQSIVIWKFRLSKQLKIRNHGKRTFRL
jgi:glycosyltransferase involved in cell wall biosynthesis